MPILYATNARNGRYVSKTIIKRFIFDELLQGIIIFATMMNDEQYMMRALELAALGRGQVSPNPMVGCVIVHNDRIAGEGWHRRYGDWHAEVNAVNAVEHPSVLSEATAYVTLEPCSHFGKTPPCSDLLIRHRLKRVVICNLDSNPLVSGRGIAKLQEAGIEVETGILEGQGRALNSRFFTYVEKKRPYVILKWAETADGFIARTNYDSKWISHPLSRKLVHQWRAEEDAILVGTRTALYDNPQLNVRDWSGRDPVRVVLDKQLQIPSFHHLFDQSQATICFNLLKNEKSGSIEYVQLEQSRDLIKPMLEALYQRKVQSVIVEGGSQLLQAFIEQQLWDEIRLFRSRAIFSDGIAAPAFKGFPLNHFQWYQDEFYQFAPFQSEWVQSIAKAQVTSQ
jgi:diaminohydroxyphosphoribosylaminopyrimidine deaminase / 5-amino-6-(5-phosphoribosylamino)uracil reductase